MRLVVAAVHSLQRAGSVVLDSVLSLVVLGVVVLGTAGCRSSTVAAAASPTPAGPSPADVRSSGPSAAGTDRDDPGTVANGVPRGLTAAQLRVDRDDPDQVATAFVVRLEAWDTRLDRRPNDAARRAVRYASAELSGRLLSGEPLAAPGQRWYQLERHRGWTSVRTRLGGLGPPPTNARTAVRAVSCTSVDHGRAGWIAFPATSGTYLVRLERRDRAGWTVVGYTIQ